MKYITILLMITYCQIILKAQYLEHTLSVPQFIAEVFEQYTEETGIESSFEEFFEELMLLSQYPVDLNHAERADFQKLFFLSDLQVENILYYRYKAGELLTIYELMLVEGLDMTDIRRMLPFVTISKGHVNKDKINLKKAFAYGKNEILTRFDVTPEQKRAYEKDKHGNSIYLGNKLYHHFKYRYHYKDRLLINITAEKDAGEQFWGKMQKGYDFLSASVQLKNIGRIKNLVAGDYQASFGQGLIMRQTFNTGKSSRATHVCELGSGFKRYGSTNEYNFLRGVAATTGYQNFTLHVLYSGRYVDGNVPEDVFTGFYKTGYHRTVNEFEKRNAVKQFVTGGNLSYNGSWFHVGFSTLMMKLSKPLVPKMYPYNMFCFKGDKQWVSGINYRFRLHKFNFFGETAISDMKFPAFITGLTFSPVSRVSLALLYRYYAPEYNAFFASPFSESSTIGNERGVYFGAEIFPAKKWKIAFYADSYHFPWLRYGVDFPSNGKDFLLQLNYTPLRSLGLQMRVKYEQNAANRTHPSRVLPDISYNRKASFRIQSTYETGNIKFRQQVDGNLFIKNLDAPTYGLAALQEISVGFRGLPLRAEFSYLFFDAMNYENRVYVFEKDILYAFSVPSFSGAGSRYYVNLRYDISSGLTCWLKFGQLLYADGRETVGSGYELIRGNRKSEIKCLIRLKF